MSTRGLCGFRKNGQDKLAYNHCDSYPEGLGNDIVGLCRQTSIEQFNKAFDAIVLIPYGTEATSEQVKEVGSTWSTFDLSSGKSTDWCYLLDKAEGKLESYTEGGLTFMVDSADFIKSSFFVNGLTSSIWTQTSWRSGTVGVNILARTIVTAQKRVMVIIHVRWSRNLIWVLFLKTGYNPFQNRY